MKEPKPGSNLTQSFFDFETTQGKLRFGKEGSKLFIEMNGTKTYLTEDDGTLDVGTVEIGANATPVVRTNNPVIGINKPNVNIDVLDAAIGADATPLTRTKGPITISNNVNANLDALDAAIGADTDLTPSGTRTAGSVALANSILTNIDALDSAIGFEAQVSGTPNVITKTGTIFQMLDQLDAKKSTQTIKKTIGGVGVAGCDFNFVTAADQVEQVIDLGAILPSLARIIDCFARTNNVFTGAVSLAAKVGTTSAGDEIIASGTVYAADSILALAVDHFMTIAPIVAAGHIFVSVTPGANWSLVTAGKVTIYIIINNVANN
jgi:hypothetical protein